MLKMQATDSYLDFNALAKLKTQAREKTPDAIKEVAKQFESVFVGMMLKSMRQAKLAEGIFDNSQSDFYRDMYDQELSVHLAGEGGIGLADLIEKQLSPNQSKHVDQPQKIADYERQVLMKIIANNKSNETLSESAKKITGVSINSQVSHNTEGSPLKSIQSAEDFVKQLSVYAEQAAKQLGVDSNVLLAQSALETGWGKSVIKSSNGSTHNLFNIKADKSWKGQKTHVSTLEFREGVAKKEIAGFRSYTSYKESFDDYVNFIKTNPRYRTAIKMAAKPEQYMQELQKAGYATDPAYASKVMKIYQRTIMPIQESRSLVMSQASVAE